MRNINTAFGEGSVSERTTRHWFKKFRFGDTNRDNLLRGHAFSVIDDAVLKNVIEANSRLTVWEIAGRFNIHHSIVVRHLKALGKVKKLDKVSHKLIEENKMRRLKICTSLLFRQNNGILHRMVMCDEKWILHDNRQRSAQWCRMRTHAKTGLSSKDYGVYIWWSSRGMYIIRLPNEVRL